MAASSPDDRKQSLRAAWRARVRSITPERAHQAGGAIAARLARWSRWQAASTVALFSSLAGEVDTGPIVASARRDGKRILLPRMVGHTELEFAVVEAAETLVRGRHGLLEPDSTCATCPIAEASIVFVPGLAFDRVGGRLGRGAGYYDRALARLVASRDRPRFIGLGFAEQILDSVPMNAHDVRMDGLMSETECVGIVE